MNFLKFIGLCLVGVFLIPIPAIYFITGSMELRTILLVAIPFLLACVVAYYFMGIGKRKSTH